MTNRSRLTTLVPNNLWDVKEPTLFEKSRGHSLQCGCLSLSLISCLSHSCMVWVGGWVGG